jgi:hypothetical protein
MLSTCFERIEHLRCARNRAGATRSAGLNGVYLNRVTEQSFLSSCTAEARTLIESLGQRFGNQVKLVFGGKSMTITSSRSLAKRLSAAFATSKILL